MNPRDFDPSMFRDPAILAGERTEATIRRMMSGEATFIALIDAIQEISRSALEDHDVLIQAFNILVTDVRFLQPHTLFLSGFNQDGDRTVVVAHFSQMVAHAIYLPKRGPERIITGFATP